MKTRNKIVCLMALLASVRYAPADIIFQDNFDSFSLGTTWTTGPEGLPNQTLQVINDGGTSVLDMASNLGATVRELGIETIPSFSTAGLTSITTDVLFKSFNGLVSMDMVIHGSSGGDRWYIQPFGNSRLTWDHPANYSDGFGTNHVIYPQTTPGTFYNVSLTMDSQGSHIALKDTSNNILAISNYAPNTFSSLGSSFTLGLRQTTGGGATAEAYIDKITVSATSSLQVQQVTRPAAVSLISALHSVNNTQLEVFANGQFVNGGPLDTINTNKPTIVLTHGFNSSPDAAFNDPNNNRELADFIKELHPDFNVVAWNWRGDAGAGTGLDLGLAESRTPNQGVGLAHALSAALGSSYSQPIQFIGHSLGTLVDAEAAQVFRNNVSASSAADTQITLFDDAEIANLASGATTWLSAIPKQGTANTIDNYISEVGNLHTEARNIVLERPALMNDVDFHSYPITWYQSTVSDPNSSTDSGFKLSITTGATPGNISNSYYYGGTDGSVTQIPEVAALGLIAQRNLGYIKYLPVAGIFGAIAIEGHVLPGIERNIDSLTSLFIATPLIQLIKQSPSYAWLTIAIPAGAETMLFDFKFDNLSEGDWLSVGINDTLLFALESQYVINGEEATSTPLDVTNWAGQNVELFLGLNNVDDENAGGDITVHNIRFQVVPETGSAILLGLGIIILISYRRRGGGYPRGVVRGTYGGLGNI